MTIIRNEDGSYLPPEQIVFDLFNRTTEQEQAWIRQGCVAGLGVSEFENTVRKQTLLRWIRNNYGMWEQDNPYVCINDPASDFKGVQDSVLFPDNLSEWIVKRYSWELHKRMIARWEAAREHYAVNSITPMATEIRVSDKPAPVTMVFRLAPDQVAEIKAYIDEAVKKVQSVRDSIHQFTTIVIPSVENAAAFKASGSQILRAKS